MTSKTNLGGLLSAIGISLSSGAILTQLTQIFPKAMPIPNGVLIACWYIAVAGVVLKIVGACLTSFFAAEDSDLQAVKNTLGPTPVIPPQPPNPQGTP